MALLFAWDPDQLRTSFCAYGAARAWVMGGKSSPLPSFISLAEFNKHVSFLSPSHGGSLGPPLE